MVTLITEKLGRQSLDDVEFSPIDQVRDPVFDRGFQKGRVSTVKVANCKSGRKKPAPTTIIIAFFIDI